MDKGELAKWMEHLKRLKETAQEAHYGGETLNAAFFFNVIEAIEHVVAVIAGPLE